MPRFFTSSLVVGALLVGGALRADPPQEGLKAGLDALEKGDRNTAAMTFINAFNAAATVGRDKNPTCMLLISSAGRLFAESGNAPIAAQCFERLYAISLAINGPTDPHTVTLAVHLAHYMGRAGTNMDLAKRLCSEGVAACRMDPDIPRHVYLRALYTHADILFAEKDRIGSAMAFRDYLKPALAEPRPAHNVIATIYFRLGNIDNFFGRAADAKVQFQHAAEHLQKGRREVTVEAFNLRLGIADQVSGAESAEVLQQLLGDLARVPGVSTNVSLQQVWCATEFKLAILESQLNRHGALVARLKSAIAHGIAGYGEDDSQLLQIYLQLAKLHLSKGQNKEGVECYRRVLAIRIKSLGPEHESVAVTQKILDDLLADLKKSGEL